MKNCAIYLFIFFGFYSCKESAPSKPIVVEDLSESATVVLELESSKRNHTSKKSLKINKNFQDDWYWKNTIKSTDNKFENWNDGAAILVITHKLKQGESTPSTTAVGTIDPKGVITISLPKKIETTTTLDNLGNFVFYDIQDIGNIHYENGKTGYYATTSLNVVQNGKPIGSLTLGNSVRVTYNLTNQSTLTMGDEGYIISWVYVKETASMQGNETRTAKMRRDGTNSIEGQTKVVYDLNFKPGWNTVKTEIIGSYDLKHDRGLNSSWFKKHEHTVIAQIPNDADYFFRKLNY